jgi:cysteinyl-tRNA synthetase
MTLRVYNTLTHRKDPFEPLDPAHVRMYVCGVTVYDECHVGHARSAMAFDVIYRYLLHRGYQVTYVRNFTDVDDKILDRAKREGIPWDQIARTYTRTFHRDMDALGILRPTVEPLATEHIPLMIQAIQGLERKGLAYAVDGNVYFAVENFSHYGKLSRRDQDQMLAGARVEVDELKRDPLDFALWKRSRPDEPAWTSPWGPGRPGWHIECSCMSQKYLGETFDIHGGGLDLVFPHHENEIAQAQGLTGRPFARFWIHNGPLTREGIKMSKSLGNILSIQEALGRYHPEEIRIFMLMGHYRKPLDFSAQAMTEAQAALERLYATLLRLENALADRAPDKGNPSTTRPAQPAEGHMAAVQEKGMDLAERFREAMDDDFNTARALAHLFDLNRVLNHWLDDPSFVSNLETAPLLVMARERYALYGKVLGLLTEEPHAFFRRKEDLVLRARGLTRDAIQSLLEKRAKARQAKDWKEADRIRKELADQGIQIQDGPAGTTWRVRAAEQ